MENGSGGTEMKKKLYVLPMALMLSATTVFGVTACGNEKADMDAPAFADAAATLTLTGKIDKQTERNRISPDLFGLFLEDINFAGYALDDNLVSNGSFENIADSAKTKTWTASSGTTLKSGNTEGIFAGNAAFGGINANYAEIEAANNGYIENKGFDAVPIAVKAGEKYVFSAFIKAGSYQGKVAVEVTDGTKTYAEKEITVSAGSEWIKYQTTLTAEDTANAGLSLRIVFRNAGKILIDCVKLETADATVGFKNYMYDAIKNLSPAFFRFPGGCIIEGRNDESYYDWKNSIGAVKTEGKDAVPAFTYQINEDGKIGTRTTYGEQATRTYNTDIWYYSPANASTYYQMEYGIGFYEYFLLCESLGAKAIPIVNCGYSCQPQTPGSAVALKGRHGNGVQDFIQDAKDLVAFAKGSVKSSDPNERYWAQVRTDMGHPKPFEMDYIGIGNEQWGRYYTDFYEKFLDSFRKDSNVLYRSVTPIVGNCTMFEHCENTKANRKGVAQLAAQAYKRKGGVGTVAGYGVHDQHYYVNYTDFLANTDLYDTYQRPDTAPDEYYDVFVGEYSANSDTTRDPAVSSADYRHPMNSVLTALSEAAMMTGFERNGDIVKLAAYAPMFGNLTKPANRQWAVNMMYFNNTELLLTPNYYVQQLFMKHSGDYKVTSELEFAGEKPQTVYESSRGGASRTLDDFYYVTSADRETGDVIVKIVNAGNKEIKTNVQFALSGVSCKGIAEVVTFVGNKSGDVSTLDHSALRTATYKIGGFTGKTFGYTVQPYSVCAIRIRTK